MVVFVLFAWFSICLRLVDCWMLISVFGVVRAWWFLVFVLGLWSGLGACML